MAITIRFGAGNSIQKPVDQIAHTSDISDDVYSVLGATRDSVETRVAGAAFTGALADGDVVDLVVKSSSKGC